MVGKSLLKKRLKQIQALKTWQLLILLVLTIFVAATALRLNNVEMIRRRDAVVAADNELDENKAQARLIELRDFASAHMNSEVVVQLEKIYERDSQKAFQAASESANNNPNGNIYKKAAEVCDPRYSGYSSAYQACMMAEIEKYGASGEINDKIKYPEASLYIYRFSSPFWSPDLAGWTILVAGLIIIFIIGKLIFTFILRMMLKKHKPFI
ncbi:MAG: hypothetical protein Q4A27_01090 [bacterium]|nr:hypothetical protein [bacterium]